jgi:hypothetical protein
MVKGIRGAADPTVVPQHPSVLHPAVRILATVLLFVPIWYGFFSDNAFMLATSVVWTLVVPLILRDMWFEVDQHDALHSLLELAPATSSTP